MTSSAAEGRPSAIERRVSCPACRSDTVRVLGPIPADDLFAGRRLPRARPGGTLWACETCHLRFRHPRPSKAALDALYAQGSADTWHGVAERRPDWLIAATWIRRDCPSGRILDVGCFDGGFMSHLGEPYERSGVEIHAEAALRAERRGVRIVGRDLADLAALAGFDAVVALDVIEHVEDPLAFLAALAGTARRGGTIILSSGNSESRSFRLMGSRYWYCTHAEHLCFVGPRWCRDAADRLGLELSRIERFAHDPAPVARRVAELAKNLLYRGAPAMAAWLRRHGAGGKDVAADPSLADHPPSWISARDHFIVRFVKAGPA